MDVSSTTVNPASAADATLTGADKLRKASKQLEGVFYGMMLKEMRKTVPADGLLPDDSHQQEIFQEMMDDHVAQNMADQSGDSGLGAQLYKQLSGVKVYAAQKSMPGLQITSTVTGKVLTDVVR